MLSFINLINLKTLRALRYGALHSASILSYGGVSCNRS